MRFVLCLAVLLLSTSVASAGKQAFIVGNADYRDLQRLKNTTSDSLAYKQAFEKLGYSVSYQEDLDLDQMLDAFDVFLSGIEAGDEIAFVFSGHGWSDGQVNYLIPTDAPKSGSDRKLKRSSLALSNGRSGVIDEIKSKGASLVLAIIDACRDNPFAPPEGTKSTGLSRGLARVEAAQETFVIFSAGEGQQALDRLPTDSQAQKLSVFTRNFLPRLTSGMYLEDAISEAQVETATQARGVGGHLQHPAYYDQTLGKTCISGNCADAKFVATEPTSIEPESRDIQSIDPTVIYLDAIRSGQQAPLEKFINQYPNHPKAAHARKLLVRIVEDDFWASTEQTNTSTAYENYLLVFSDGRYQSEAEERLQALSEQARKTHQRILPTFDCKYAKTPVELAICSNDNLAQQDHDLVAVFKRRESEGLVDIDKQSEWVSAREDFCSNSFQNVVECTRDFTADRIATLSGLDSYKMGGVQRTCPMPSGDYGVRKIPDDDTLFVRSGPGKSHLVVGELPFNANGVRVKSCTKDNWCAVQSGCITGYSYGYYLAVAQRHLSDSEFNGLYRVVNHPMDEMLNVRAGPSINYGIVAELPADATGIVVSDCQNKQGYKFRWCHLNWGEISGWSYGRYLADQTGRSMLSSLK